MEENKNWYAVITADVLYDAAITPRQKLLVAMIANMSNSKGYCFATNKYFSNVFGCSVSSIQRDISALEGKYIGRVIELDENGEVKYRALTPIAPMTPPPSTGATTPHSTHAIYNNISSNNKTNNTQTDFEEVWALFPKKKDKHRAKKYYDSKSRESERADIKAAVIRYAAERKGLEKDQYTITGGNFFVNERWREYVPTQEEIEAVKIPQISESNGIPSEKLTELWELAQKQSDPLQYFKSFCRMEVSQ